MKFALALIAGVTLAAAAHAQDTQRWERLDEPELIETPQNLVLLEVSELPPPPQRALEVGLVLFDPGVDGDSLENRQQGIYPEIRDAEVRYLPYALRRVLVDSNQWGAVRVLPGDDPGYELLVTGRILVSNGAELSVALTVRDARNVVWLDQIYSEVAEENAYLETERRLRRPFQNLYNRFANDLLALRRDMDDRTLIRIREVSEVRYAASLLPDAFSEFVDRNELGEIELQRLPAANDPMLARIRRVREQEYLFIDTTDEQYAELYTHMTPVYDLWRQYQREQQAYRDVWEARLADRMAPPRGSYEAMKQQYNNYKWEKIQRQEMKTLAEGFNNEIEPTALQLEGTVVKLNGSLDQRYREWRDILRRIYSLETGR